MDRVQIKRAELIDVLKKNRHEHRAVFDKAIAGFQRRAVEVLQQRVESAKKGLNENLYVSLTMPQDQTKEYDRKIRMFEMDVRDVLDLTEQEFTCYVMDDWSWKAQVTATNSQYL